MKIYEYCYVVAVAAAVHVDKKEINKHNTKTVARIYYTPA